MPVRFLIALVINLIGVALPAQAREISWTTDPAQIVIENSERPMLLFFHREGDIRCDRMERWTFTNRRVVEATRGTHPLSIDVDARPALAQRFEVRMVPTCVLIVPGEEVQFFRQEGVAEARDLARWLNISLGRQTQAQAEVADPGDRTTSSNLLDAIYQEETRQAPAAVVDELPNDPVPLTPLTESQVEPEGIEARHRPVRTAREGEELPIQIYVPGGATRVTLHYRLPGESISQDIQMTPNTPSLFYAVIPGEAVTFHGLEYDFTIQRGSTSAPHPVNGEANPYHVTVH